MTSTEQVYLDNAATTTLSPAALEAMIQAAKEYAGNPNSLHNLGRSAFAALEECRGKCAQLLGAARPSEIVFTSGGTESDVAALVGIAVRAPKHKDKVLVSAMEHHAVLECRGHLKELGFVMEEVRPNSQGFITPELLQAAVSERACLVSVHLANNEVGTVQPITELAEVAHGAGALMHTDGVQAPGRVPCNLQQLGVDAASFSSHKFHGPRGVGILYLKGGTPFAPLLAGGGQEDGRRGGTQNVVGVVGMVTALQEVVEEQEAENARLQVLRDRLIGLLDPLEGVHLMCDPRQDVNQHLANLVAFAVDGCESETLVLMLSQAGFAVSGGSACSSHIGKASHVLLAIGIDQRLADGQLRVTLGRETQAEDIPAFVQALQEVIGRVRG